MEEILLTCSPIVFHGSDTLRRVIMYMYESNVHQNTHIKTLHCNVTLCGRVGPMLIWHKKTDICENCTYEHH
jgi:hypothetical protein